MFIAVYDTVTQTIKRSTTQEFQNETRLGIFSARSLFSSFSDISPSPQDNHVQRFLNKSVKSKPNKSQTSLKSWFGGNKSKIDVVTKQLNDSIDLECSALDQTVTNESIISMNESSDTVKDLNKEKLMTNEENAKSKKKYVASSECFERWQKEYPDLEKNEEGKLICKVCVKAKVKNIFTTGAAFMIFVDG